MSAGTSNATDAESSSDIGDYTHEAFQFDFFYPAWSDTSTARATK